MTLDLRRTEALLKDFDFHTLFIEQLGWGQPASKRTSSGEVQGNAYHQRMIAQLAGVSVFEIWTAAGLPDRKLRDVIERDIAKLYRENLCIFLDKEKDASQSFWVWANRERGEDGKPRRIPREHSYFRGQPADLFLTKLQALVFELSDFSEKGNLTVVEVARRMKEALDVERVTKKFYTSYEAQHSQFLELIEGIPNERDRRWYASILLNRLMFVWFLQKKGFVDGGDYDYLDHRFKQSQAHGKNRFYSDFLQALFFEAFAKPEQDRSAEARAMTGKVRYLNGGLFLKHRIELEYGDAIHIPDEAFDNLFGLFRAYSWNLDDTPGGKADEINPDVLGYIFEKYINQKAFGAYYTRPEITEYLSERTIYALVLQKVNQPAVPELKLAAIEFESVPDMLSKMDGRLCLDLIERHLPSLSILDPAVGSGAFLVAAMKVLMNIYGAVLGRVEVLRTPELLAWKKHLEAEHKNLAYYIKRKIITDNLFGVDIMEEGTEIAKLRLFLALVASARNENELEPLPNIDFNILAGNSLIGLTHVDAHEFENSQDDLFKTPYRKLLEEKNRDIQMYRQSTGLGADLAALRSGIEEKKRSAKMVLNELLRDDFERLGIKYEQATWDLKKNKEGKPEKRRVEVADIERQTPFHWGYEFDEIMQQRGGFDAIITNPPWDVLQTDEKEFFQSYIPSIQKNKLRIEDWKTQQTKLMKDKELRDAWLRYASEFPHIANFYKNSPDYVNQQSFDADGRKVPAKTNLYLLFTERCFNLVKPEGRVGIVIPSGIYTDRGAKGLRDLLFSRSHINGLFCFENRKAIFEGVDSRFKFVVLTFEKSAMPRVVPPGIKSTSAPPDDLLAAARTGDLGTQRFPAAFMRHDVGELARFPQQGAIEIDVGLVKRLSPDSHSVMEFKSVLDVHIAEKMLQFPMLGDSVEGKWRLSLTQEFNMTIDSDMFKTVPGRGRLPLYEGKLIHQFTHEFSSPRYWMEQSEADSELRRSATRRLRQLLKPEAGVPDEELDTLIQPAQIKLDYETYRFGFRDIARNTDERSMMCAVLPPQVFAGNTINLQQPYEFVVKGKTWEQVRLMSANESLFASAVFNSFTVDWLLRQKITSHVNMFYVFQVPMPRLTSQDKAFGQIAKRAARLVCITPDFDALAKDVGLGNHNAGTTDAAERAQVRAELDGLIAHLYRLTEAEFAHILTTFPSVADPIKQAARNAYRDVDRGLIK